MTMHRAPPAAPAEASDLLPRLPLEPADLAAHNGILRRVGSLSARMGGEALVIDTTVPDGDLRDAAWWTIEAGGTALRVGVSDGLLGSLGSLPATLAFETLFDPALTALEAHLGRKVDVLRSDAPVGAAVLRTFRADWGRRDGHLALACDRPGLQLAADVMARLPFAAPPARDVRVAPAIEIGRFDLQGAGLPTVSVGELLLPRPEDVSIDEGRLILGRRTIAAVALRNGWAEVAAGPGADQGTRESPGGIAIRIPCAPISRAALADLSPADEIPFERPRSGAIELLHQGRPVGRGALVRVGERIAVEIRAWRPLPGAAARAGGHPHVSASRLPARQGAERST